MKKLIIQGILLGAASVMTFAQTTQSTTPTQTQGTMTDSQMSSQIRQAIMNDNTTQPVAHNVRVTTKNGMVTLKGKVDSTAEKDAMVQHAKQLAGDSNVKDEITVKQ